MGDNERNECVGDDAQDEAGDDAQDEAGDDDELREPLDGIRRCTGT